MMWEYSAGIVPYFQKGSSRKYLLLRSALTKEELWEFPKGAIEKGEHAADAARREFSEETGIEKFELIPDFKKGLKYFYRREGVLVGKTVTYFLGRSLTEKVTISHESTAYVWLNFDEAYQRLRHKNLRSLLKQAEDFLNLATTRESKKDR